MDKSFLSADHGVVSGEATQRVFLHLDTYVLDTGVRVREKLPLCCRCNSQPISCGQNDCFAIDYDLGAARENAVNFFILPMRVDKRDACACGKSVDADFRAGQGERVVQLASVFIANGGFCIIFHSILPPNLEHFRLLP